MSQFNFVPDLVDEHTGWIIGYVRRPTLITISDSVGTVDLTPDDAIALRDWLNKALPDQNGGEQS